MLILALIGCFIAVAIPTLVHRIMVARRAQAELRRLARLHGQ